MKNIKIPKDFKKKIILHLPYLFIFYFGDKFGEAYRLSVGDTFQKIVGSLANFNKVMTNPLPSLNSKDLLVGVTFAVLVFVIVYFKKKNAKKYRKDVEYGSARFGNEKDAKPFMDENPDNNIILTQTEGLTMNSRPKPVKNARNKNVLVIGGSGSGKTRFFIKPNLMQCQSKSYPVSFICTDPKGSLIIECGRMLRKFGYKIKILNTINFTKSMHYNPLLF